MNAHRVRLEDIEHFDRGDYGGWKYVAEFGDLGFTALRAHVEGQHPLKEVDAARVYFIISGEGWFHFEEKSFRAEANDLFIIPPGSSYSYEGKMEMFEFNVEVREPSIQGSPGELLG